jgi:hypothetical protein
MVKEALERSGQTPLFFYLGNPKDHEFTDTYGDSYTWHIAAEEPGKIGKAAIPYLIKKLDSKDDFERRQVFYALLLATQGRDVLHFTRREFPWNEGGAYFTRDKHPPVVKGWKAWGKDT